MKLFCARYLLPVGAPLIEGGALLVEGGRILAVGPCHALITAQPGAEVIDFGEATILPPLVNAHTHLELTDFPQWAEMAGEGDEPADFVDWILRLVRVRRAVNDGAARDSLARGLQQSLAAGTGAVGDILTTLDAAGGYADTPLPGRVFAEVLGLDPVQVAARLAAIGKHLGTPPGPVLAWGLSPHAPYTLSRETLAMAIAFADEHALPLAIHRAETAEEVRFLTEGQGPLERLYLAAGWPWPPKLAEVPYAKVGSEGGGLLIHGVHLRDDEIGAVARAGQHVVLCPRSNSRFGATRAPLVALRQAGVPLAIGTDSRASSPSLSVWEELAFARSWFAGVLEPEAWLEIATLGGAKALGLTGRAGRLAAGMAASFQVVTVPPGAAPATLVEALCAGGTEITVQALFICGENVLPRG